MASKSHWELTVLLITDRWPLPTALEAFRRRPYT
jgi:hypothetical protein